MPSVGLSTLYLFNASADFDVVTLEIARDRSEDQKPDYWELIDEGQHSLNTRRTELVKTLVQVGYNFTVHAPFKEVEIAHPDSGRRLASIKRIKQTLDASAEIEAKLVVLHPGSVFPGNEELNATILADLVDYGADVGLKCAIENMIPSKKGPQIRHMVTPGDFKKFWNTTGSRAGLVFDIVHAHLGGLVNLFVGELVAKIVEVHASDTRGEWDEHLKVGEGNIPWNSIVAELKKNMFRGPYMIESVEKPFESVAQLKQVVRTAYRL